MRGRYRIRRGTSPGAPVRRSALSAAPAGAEAGSSGRDTTAPAGVVALGRATLGP